MTAEERFAKTLHNVLRRIRDRPKPDIRHKWPVCAEKLVDEGRSWYEYDDIQVYHSLRTEQNREFARNYD